MLRSARTLMTMTARKRWRRTEEERARSSEAPGDWEGGKKGPSCSWWTSTKGVSRLEAMSVEPVGNQT